MAKKKPDPESQPAAHLKDNPVNPERPQDPNPDDTQTPKNFTPRGDALPITDPLLSPEAQQPFESEEDYEQRVGKPEPAPGTFDEMVSRGEDQK